ncbi:hypothetical protein RN001_003361 [Aquatica leii]|uniref:Uncharacterized protein n=1 Tax=Aquatica leii TaxID=1421715 RepID=A0AAN7QBM5_9COLE|nr:hypothetical protein RN001_003361 [Aquatica leii]
MDQQNKFYVVEFPEEVNKMGNLAMAIISSKWVFTENNELQCYWPTKFGKDSYIGSYQKAKRELKNLEVCSNLSQSGSSECENEKRNPKKKVLKDFVEYLDSSSDDEPPKVHNETYFPRCTQTSQEHARNFSATELEERQANKIITAGIQQTPSVLSLSKDVSHEKKCACCIRNQEFYKIIFKKLDSLETKLNQLSCNNKIKEGADNFGVNIDTMDNLFEVKDFDANLQNTEFMAMIVSYCFKNLENFRSWFSC